MPIFKIITIPNPVLRKKSTELDFKTIKPRELSRLISGLIKTMLAAGGVGYLVINFKL